MELSANSCRCGLTPHDLDFIQRALKIDAENFSGRKGETDSLLDHPELFQALIEDQDILTVSPKFYFYVLLRHTLTKYDIKSPEVADYLGSVLNHASVSEKIFNEGQPHFYLSDALKKVAYADISERFYQQVHFANLSLIMSGIFSDRINHREERKAAPSLDHFISVGKSYYTAAGQHRLAQEYTLDEVFQTLGTDFHTVCQGLNQISDRLFFLCPPPPESLLE